MAITFHPFDLRPDEARKKVADMYDELAAADDACEAEIEKLNKLYFQIRKQFPGIDL